MAKQKATVDEWLVELSKASAGATDGMTTQEIADRTGVCVRSMQRKVNVLVRSGKWKFVGWKATTRIDGSVYSVPAYAPVKGKR